MFKQVYHILSDLHLEHRLKISSLKSFMTKYPQLNNNGLLYKNNKDKVLILAGDIGHPELPNYWKFLEDCCDKYKHVLCVPGNHEYYSDNYTIDDINTIIKTKSQEMKADNLHYLIDRSIKIDNITYLGTTLWSQLPEKNKHIKNQLNDFNWIKHTKYKKISMDQYNLLHKQSVDWLQSQLLLEKEKNNNNLVIITHYLPTFQLKNPKYGEGGINHAFYTDLEEMITGKMWVCGHTHSQMFKKINGTLMAVNPFGYDHECEFSELNETIIEFD